MEIYVNDKKIRLDPAQSIGKGGEADVFCLGPDQVVKIFKAPDHPDYTGQPEEQCAAEIRIAEHQKKLHAFPSNLPDRVVIPDMLVTDANNTITGYVMRSINDAEVLMRYGDRSFRKNGIASTTVTSMLLDLHKTVEDIHNAGVVIGDFNDLNVLVQDTAAYMIDADSFQFSGFPCRVFTSKFVDPLLCAPDIPGPILSSAYGMDSDWYAFTIMVMQSFLYVGPYGGVYRPGSKSAQMPHTARPLHRITVFHPEVKYPKPALRYDILPDDLLQYLHTVFVKDDRGVFPKGLLEELVWQTCDVCGTVHGRSVCPACARSAPAAIKEVVVVEGEVTASRIFRTEGIILHTVMENGSLRWLYHDRKSFRREDNLAVLSGLYNPGMRYEISGKNTLIGQGGQFVQLRSGRTPEHVGTDIHEGRPQLTANEDHVYWIDKGQLLRTGRLGQVYIGDVLPGQTRIWVGPAFGFGLYRAAGLCVAFLFDADQPGIDDRVSLPLLRGRLIDATCVFTYEKCWFFTATQEGGKTINRCIIIRRDGMVDATTQAIEGDGTWLGTIHGKCAVGQSLFAPTDDGVVRLDLSPPDIQITRTFPDTERFVDSQSVLYAGNDGLYVVNEKDILVLKIH